MNLIWGISDLVGQAFTQGFLRILISVGVLTPLLWHMNRESQRRSRLSTETFSVILTIIVIMALLLLFRGGLSYWYHAHNVQEALVVVAIGVGFPLALYLFYHFLIEGAAAWDTPPGEYIQRIREFRVSRRDDDES